MERNLHSDISLEDIFDDDNINEAINHLLSHSNQSGCGIDGVPLSALPEYWTANDSKILEMIRFGVYEPGTVRQFESVSAKGKRRILSQMNTIDRMIARAVSQCFSAEFDNQFSDNVFSYRPSRGILDAVTRACAYMEEGYYWVAEIDIEKFFDSISHELLANKLRNAVMDNRVVDLIMSFAACNVETDDGFAAVETGLIQGNSISPVLSNIYLHELDMLLEDAGERFCRFGDDLNIYCRTQNDAQRIKCIAEDFLKEECRLDLSKKKSGVFFAPNRRYLGFTFERSGDHILPQKVVYTKKGIYYNWHSTAIQKIDRDYHIINDGVLTKKDYSILFENEEQKYHIPIETANCINIYSNITFSSGFFDFIGKHGFSVSIFDRYGNKTGSFVPAKRRRNVKIEIAQIALLAEANSDERLRLAKKLEHASVFNLRANLRYYAKRKSDSGLKDAVDKLSEIIVGINNARTIDELLLLEARARQEYYRCFNEILQNKAFSFTVRTKRPPRDPLNSMISFGNTLMYQRIANEINKTSLDIRFGVIHSSLRREESLNLDLADIFKPIIIDRTIFTIVNRRMMNAEKDFREIEDGGIYLSNNGKRIFINEFERKLYQKVNIAGELRSYDYIINY